MYVISSIYYSLDSRRKTYAVENNYFHLICKLLPIVVRLYKGKEKNQILFQSFELFCSAA